MELITLSDLFLVQDLLHPSPFVSLGNKGEFGWRVVPFISRQLEFFPLDPLHLLFNQQMMAEIFHCVKDDQLAYRVARF